MNIVFICPYFGKLPIHFNYFLKSCEYNPAITWLIYTDDTSYKNIIPNVHIRYTTFEDIKRKIQSKFDFEVSLDYAYKLCDFRPAYGYIFEDDVRSFDFWGHCDFDIILGDLKSFIETILLSDYEKIFTFGHMTLYKNNERTNKRFMNTFLFNERKISLTYKDIMKYPYNLAFDEDLIGQIYDQYNIPVYKSCSHVIDIDPMYGDFYSAHDKSVHDKYYVDHQIILWNRGHLYSKYILNGSLQSREFAYLHFPKRNIPVSVKNYFTASSFLITPNLFINDFPELNKENIINFSKKTLFDLNEIKQTNFSRSMMYGKFIKQILKNKTPT